MALHIIATFLSKTIPSSYYVPLAITTTILVAIRTFSQGRRTTRDRDLHARTVIITGAFTPLGLTIIEHLAKKGAHIIALVPTESLTSHHDEILTLLRSTTSNEAIYAETCPLYSPASIRSFCEKFLKSEDTHARRIDALILTHEYSHIGIWKAGMKKSSNLQEEEKTARDMGAMATFLLITLLLPAMLVAPIERDIRIINVVNPFYAAAIPRFDARFTSSKDKKNTAISARGTYSSWLLEGQRSLRTAVFTRHLQRILDALPEPDDASSSSTGTSNSKKKLIPKKKSNIMAVTVSPGVSRTDTIAPFLLISETMDASILQQWFRGILYIILFPFLYLFTKSPQSAIQTVLHVLSVPRPMSRHSVPIGEDVAQVPESLSPSSSREKPRTARVVEDEEVLVPGALYADCALIKPHLRTDLHRDSSESGTKQPAIVDEQELGLGDEPIGRKVWEVMEEGVKVWEKGGKGQGRK